MGLLVRFPQERVDYFKSTDYGRNADILILPLIRLERAGAGRQRQPDSRETAKVNAIRETPDATDCN
jgi:hypothetical protein